MADVASGDGESLGFLYCRHGRSVGVALRRWFPKMTLSDAEDLVQEIFIELGKTAPRYKERSKFKAWLFTIAHRRAQDWYSFHKRRRTVSMSDEKIGMYDGAERGLKQDTQLEMRQAIGQMMKKLPQELREVLWLKVVEGFIGSEIAEIMGIKESTVRTRIHRARGMLLARSDTANWRSVLAGGN